MVVCRPMSLTPVAPLITALLLARAVGEASDMPKGKGQAEVGTTPELVAELSLLPPPPPPPPPQPLKAATVTKEAMLRPRQTARWVDTKEGRERAEKVVCMRVLQAQASGSTHNAVKRAGLIGHEPGRLDAFSGLGFQDESGAWR